MRIRPLVAAALAALVLVPALARPAHAWGLVGHGAIAMKAAERLGLSAEEREWFAIGGIMGDIDKSDRSRTIRDPLMRFLAGLGNSYQFPALVDAHDPAFLAELVEACGRSGDRRLEAWALGVLSHRRADRTIDTYPDAVYRLDAGIAEIACDIEIFRPAEAGRFQGFFSRAERGEWFVYSPAKRLHWQWILFMRAASLKRGRDHDADVRRVDPFAAPILEAWRAAKGATGGPHGVSDVWRQQEAFDSFSWNYRLKSPLYPGRRDFVRSRGPAWFAKMASIAFDDAVDAVVAESQAWRAHLAALRAGRASSRPAIP